jgi:hypothetical protein
MQNSVARYEIWSQSFFAENRKVWTDPAKNTHKIKYVERFEIGVSLVRLAVNTISTLPEFKNSMVFTIGTIHCEVANSFPPAGVAPVSDGATL